MKTILQAIDQCIAAKENDLERMKKKRGIKQDDLDFLETLRRMVIHRMEDRELEEDIEIRDS